jgi:hypothetical protein
MNVHPSRQKSLSDWLQASKTWDEHVRASGLPENRDTAIKLMFVVPRFVLTILFTYFDALSVVNSLSAMSTTLSWNTMFVIALIIRFVR